MRVTKFECEDTGRLYGALNDVWEIALETPARTYEIHLDGGQAVAPPNYATLDAVIAEDGECIAANVYGNTYSRERLETMAHDPRSGSRDPEWAVGENWARFFEYVDEHVAAVGWSESHTFAEEDEVEEPE